MSPRLVALALARLLPPPLPLPLSSLISNLAVDWYVGVAYRKYMYAHPMAMISDRINQYQLRIMVLYIVWKFMADDASFSCVFSNSMSFVFSILIFPF